MKPTKVQMQDARRLFGRVAAKYPRALAALKEHDNEVVTTWVRFVAHCLQQGNAEQAEKRLIKHLHRLTMQLEKEAAERVARALLRRADETG